MSLDQFDGERSLGGLKDFQRRSVDYVSRRMWRDDPPATRFLVADEVGLGKTHVARGVIARTLEYLRDKVERIDVVYVCSNAAIAQQNVNRLNVLGHGHFAMATRLTLLPLQMHELERNRVNFVSFTPGTTFDLKSSGGIKRERVLLHRLLVMDLPDLRQPLLHVLRCAAGLESFQRAVATSTQPLNRTLGHAFLDRVRSDAPLMGQIHEACSRFQRARAHPPHEDRVLQYRLVGELRQLLARVCVDALQPDLVILDEFQRFRDLLDGKSEAAELARALMEHRTPEGHDVRVLLLSATPYKPLTLSTEEEDHYADFLRTLGFLFDAPKKLAQLEEHLRIYRRGLYTGGAADSELLSARQAVERMLRSVMVRTERVRRTERADAMLTSRLQDAPLLAKDLDQARLLHEVATHVGADDPVEYWKSAPHLLHFMKDYQLKRKLESVADRPPPALVETLSRRRDRLLSKKQVGRYRELEPANGRLRVLLEEMVQPGQWQLLWMPPILPYVEPGGAFREVPDFTKALIFSSWNVVPDAISAICSYEVERRMIHQSGDVPHYSRLHRRRSPLLRFAFTRGRPTGMPGLALLYPSIALSQAVDPLRLALGLGDGRPVTALDIRAQVSFVVEDLLRQTGRWPTRQEGSEDQRWYWAALAMLDRPYLSGFRRWMSSAGGWRSALASHEEDTGLQKHIELFRRAADGELDHELGPAPDNLVEILVEFALASPAICASRALSRMAPTLAANDRHLASAAAHIAGGFRTLFNLPETISLLRGGDEEAYWRLVLHHGVDGNLQAVLDEYAHLLYESLGLREHEDHEVVHEIAGKMAEALSLRTAPIQADDISVTRSGRLRLSRYRFRCRYALRFGELRDDQDKTLARVGTVREAFNSPFRPFILATTSVGQEGLDFHPYCHAVYHWNLPSNPVDLEQREGRVHRYKGHAVRKNVGRRFGLDGLRERLDGRDDPWQVLFDAAAAERPPAASDLVPYWIYPIEGGANVERRVPMFPFSREHGKLAGLQRGLAFYRLAFGQPRQEDLLAYLAERAGEGSMVGIEKWRISLEPPEELS